MNYIDKSHFRRALIWYKIHHWCYSKWPCYSPQKILFPTRCLLVLAIVSTTWDFCCYLSTDWKNWCILFCILSLCFIQDVKVLLRTHIKFNTSINPSSTSDSTLHRKLAERRSIIHLLLLLLLICVSICTSIFGDFTDVNYLMTSMPGDADLKQCNRSRYLFSLAKVACDR